MTSGGPGDCSVDIHTHLAPALDLATATRLGTTLEGGRQLLDGHAVGPAALYEPDALVRYLDGAGVDLAVVSVPPPFFRQHLGEAEAAEWVGAVNDGLLAATADRHRLRPLAYLPLEHPSVALGEYERVRADGRWVGVVAAAGGASRALDDPELAELWRTIDADARTVLLHPAATPDARLDRYYLANLLGNPIETGVAVAQIVFGGLLSTYPRLRFVLSHCGGIVPAVVGRWQRGYETDRPGVLPLALPPHDAVRRLYVDTVAHDPAVVDLAATVFGQDRLVLGSDWPFPMGVTDPRSLVAHRGGAQAQQIAVTNAASAMAWKPRTT